jgi:acetylornithine deacetylase/succinyl-diaminopimelate desuccinylase-like protein
MMLPRLAAIGALFVLSCCAAFAQEPQIDWAKTNKEIFQDFTSLIKIDSSNPPGNETQVAKYLQSVLEKEGISSMLVGADPNRLSLIARLKGNGSKKPILIMGHTDVVGVQRDRWSEDPFGAKLIDGYIWGRGTIDDKDLVTGALMTMILLKRSGVPLDRDVIFVAEAGEEGGSPNRTFGISYLIDHNYPDIDAEYCLTEGGDFTSTGGKVQYQLVQVSEKEGRGMKLVAHGTSGHGSMPREDNAIVHLATAVGKLGAWQPPMELTPITKLYLEGLEKVSTPEETARLKALFDPAKTEAAQEYFRANNIRMNSTLRTSISPNIIQGGFRANVIPSEATATLDIRAVPGEDIDKFKALMEKVIDDPEVQIVTPAQWRPETPSSSIDTELYRDLASVQQSFFPGTETLPGMSTGGTDMKGLRAKGMQCYGIGAELPTEDLITHAMHSDNERIKESGLYTFVRYEYSVVAKIASNASATSKGL